MNVQLYAAPTLEPITLQDLADQAYLDPDTLSENLTPYTCTPAGSHPVTTGYTLYGTAVEVIGKKAIAYLRPTNNGAGATVDCKIQESDDGTTWTDWTGGAFPQVTEANDTAIQEKEYAGVKRYIRTASKTLVLACEFGTDVIVKEAVSAESDLLTRIISSAREYAEEDVTNRQLLTATWDYFLGEWPSADYGNVNRMRPDAIKLPFGNLQTVTSVSWKGTAGTEAVLIAGTDYIVETNGIGIGFVVLPPGTSWPSGSLYSSNPIKVRFTCGWASAAAIPAKIRTALLMKCKALYDNRSEQEREDIVTNEAVRNMLRNYRLYDEF